MIVAYGTKRVVDMSREELIVALNEMCFRYVVVHREKMASNEVPVFHEDMDKWNDKLAEWFNVPTVKTNVVAEDT